MFETSVMYTYEISAVTLATRNESQWCVKYIYVTYLNFHKSAYTPTYISPYLLIPIFRATNNSKPLNLLQHFVFPFSH